MTKDNPTLPLSYQWFKGPDLTNPLPDKGTGNNYIFCPLKLSDAGVYHCKITCTKLKDWHIESDYVTLSVKRELSACSVNFKLSTVVCKSSCMLLMTF